MKDLLPPDDTHAGPSAGRKLSLEPPTPRPLPAGARSLLEGSTAQVLERLIEEDPLDLRARVALGLARQAFLFDPDVAALRCASRIARFGRRYTGRPALATWLDGEIDAALDDLVRSDARAAQPGAAFAGNPRAAADHRTTGLPAREEAERAFHAEQPHVARLARALELAPDRARAVCRAHNECAPDDRRAFRLLVLEERGLDESARLERVSGSEIGRRARRVLDAVLDAADEGDRRRTR